MKSLVIVLLVLGLIMMALGYQKKLIQNMETKTVIEYRFIPRSIYEDQFGPVNLRRIIPRYVRKARCVFPDDLIDN